MVSPGGVGFDIACGVRLLAAGLSRDELVPVLGRVMDQLAAVIPRGAGRGGLWELHGRAELGKLLAGGAGLQRMSGRNPRPGHPITHHVAGARQNAPRIEIRLGARHPRGAARRGSDITAGRRCMPMT